jgi:hypothetical protein
VTNAYTDQDITMPTIWCRRHRFEFGSLTVAVRFNVFTFFMCTMLAVIRTSSGGWRGRVVLRPQDKLGFLRFKKVGSTTVSTYLHEVCLSVSPTDWCLACTGWRFSLCHLVLLMRQPNLPSAERGGGPEHSENIARQQFRPWRHLPRPSKLSTAGQRWP